MEIREIPSVLLVNDYCAEDCSNLSSFQKSSVELRTQDVAVDSLYQKPLPLESRQDVYFPEIVLLEGMKKFFEKIAGMTEAVANRVIELPSEKMHKVIIPPQSCLFVKPSSMLACQDVEVEAGLNASILSVVKRFLFGGEAILLNKYSTSSVEGWVLLKGISGQISSYDLLPHEKLVMGRGAYVASDPNVEISTEVKKLGSFFKGIMGVAELVASTNEKSGRVYFASREGLRKIHKEKTDSPILVDDSIVAHSSGIVLSTQVAGFSGEGFVYEINGEGDFFIGSGGNSSRDNLVESIIKTMTPSTDTVAKAIGFAALGYLASEFSAVKSLMKYIEGFYPGTGSGNS